MLCFWLRDLILNWIWLERIWSMGCFNLWRLIKILIFLFKTILTASMYHTCHFLLYFRHDIIYGHIRHLSGLIVNSLSYWFSKTWIKIIRSNHILVVLLKDRPIYTLSLSNNRLILLRNLWSKFLMILLYFLLEIYCIFRRHLWAHILELFFFKFIFIIVVWG